MADYDLALGIKPPQIDVATPLLTAAKIRAADLAEQKHAIEMQFLPAFQQAQLRQLGLSSDVKQQELEQSPLKLAADLRQKNVTSQAAEEELRAGQIGKVLRGIAPYADKPEFQAKADEAHQELLDRGLINRQQFAAYKNGGAYSPLTLQGALARTDTAEQALKEKTPLTLKTGEQLVDRNTFKTVASNASGTFSDEDADGMADQYLAGDKSVLQNFRGTQGPINMAKVRGAITAKLKEQGRTGADQAAAIANFNAQAGAARSQAIREGNVESSINEASATFPLLLEASKKVPRHDFVPFNQLETYVRNKTSSPEQGAFYMALNGAKIAYAQAMARTGVLTVHAQEEADKLFNGITSHEALAAKITQAEKEMEAARAAPEKTRKAILDRISGKKTEGGTPAQATAPAAGAADPLGIR